MFKRNVLTIDDVLQKTLRKGGLETPMLQTHVLESWGKVAGTMVEQYTTDKYIKNQVLHVHLSSPALRSELSMKRTELVNKLNAEAGASVIIDICFY